MNEMPRDADAVQRPGKPLPESSPATVMQPESYAAGLTPTAPAALGAPHAQPQIQPLMDRLAGLQAELDETRRQLMVAQRLNRRPEHRIIDFVGTSPAAQEVKRQARRAAQADATVLLLGEPGTGKALLAHAIHAASRRAARPLLTLDMAAVPPALLEAELFGEAPKAKAEAADGTAASTEGTGALVGKLELADDGTLFLDEIGDLPMPLQAKLLRVLQEGELVPPGGSEPRPVNVRLIASTSRDLAVMVRRGEFRADLYYGLHVLPIRVPALRERIEDIESLVEVLLEDLSRRGGLPPKSLGASALAALQRRPWLGNVRELSDVLEQAFLAGSSPVLTAGDLGGLPSGGQMPPFAAALPASETRSAPMAGNDPLRLAPGDPLAGTSQPDHPGQGHQSHQGPMGNPFSSEEQTPPPTLSVRKAQLEREAIANALRQTNGNRVAAARLLAISRATLYEKLARWPELGQRPSRAARVEKRGLD